MKFLISQLSYFVGDQQTRKNLAGLLRYLLFLGGVILAYSILFHILMDFEGRRYSWLTGLYWTLTVMSTLGFGDITFESDLGRLFSIIVLASGIVLLLIVLPFTFIRYFYAPWLEAQIRARAPRRLPETTSGHVLLCSWDAIARSIAERLQLLGIPYFVIEPDPTRAAELHLEHVPVVAGDRDRALTYVAARASAARAVLANVDDPGNTNITLTVRETAPSVDVIATIEHLESLDVLELAGATHVLPLKQRLGEQLANRINTRHCEAHVIGHFKDLLIAEFPVHNTPLSGRSLRDTELRQRTGLNIVGVWDRGRLRPAQPDTVLSDWNVPVVVGTPEQIAALNRLIELCDINDNPVIILGGGKVGRSACRTLKERGVAVHLVERNPAIAAKSSEIADRVFIGEAADHAVLTEAGIARAPSVMLTTNDDAMNIYLCIYCRRLSPDVRIVSRITHRRNVDAIHRAGADFVLSHASLAQESVTAILLHRELIFAGEGLGFFSCSIPKSLSGTTLRDSGIGARTGLNVIAIEKGGQTITNPPPETVLLAGGELFAIGTADQRRAFGEIFGQR